MLQNQKNSKSHHSSSAISPTPSSSFQRPMKDRVIQSLIPIHQPVVRFDIFDNENSSASFIQLYYCEECSKETAEKKCDACQTFYCLNCCRLAHISVSFKTSIHPHEKSIRSLTRLDKGKLPIPRDNSNGYILPDSVTYEEDVLQHKDISLACSLSSPILPKIPNSKQKFHQKIKYKQGDVVLFLNPNNGIDSYGRVLSNLDAIRYSAYNSTALYRGENTVIFYEVQVLNSIQHMEQIVRRLIKEETNKEIEERKRSQIDVTEITDLKCRQYLYLAVDVNRKAGNLVRHKLASATFENAYQKKLASFYDLRCTFDKTSIVMLSESELQSPHDKLETLSSVRNAIFMKLFTSFERRKFKRIYLRSFERWRFVVNTIKKESQGRAALIIQRSWKHFSTWKSHKIAKERRDCYLREKWLALHEKFRVKEHKDDDGITYDDKLYFNTHADCSRYFFAVKKAVLKIRSQCEAVVNNMYKVVFDRWKMILVQNVNDPLYFSANFVYSMGSEEKGSNSPVLTPLKSPSSGIHLPPLKPLFTPKNAEERLFLEKYKRLEYCDFQRFAEGPTDHSCRVIPGLLSFGRFPSGSAQAGKIKSVDAISVLVLAGHTLFVSTLSEDEEVALQRKYKTDSIQSAMESAVARARLAVIKIISENNFIHDENMNKVSHFPELHTEHPNYALVKREKGRCFARATAAIEAITRAKAQLAKLPCSSFEWMRLPMSRNQGIDDIDELQAHLVCLEDKLREGKVIYIYSSEGHGRSGLLTACLLGRLYRLSSPEALYRIQACHDSRSAELSREQVVHCPSSASQRQCVQIILGESDGIGNGTVLRAGDQKSRTKDSMAEMIQRQREYNLFAGNSLPSNRDEIGPMGPLVLQRLPA